jgi:multiple sugar transport system ATP-binding protein
MTLMTSRNERGTRSAPTPKSDSPPKAHVRFRGIYKLFGDSLAVEDLNLDIYEGEFLVLVGPSGCGKTTSLRMLGGLERPTFGEIVLGGKTINRLPPKARNMAMVFQSYALYPHMSVRGNLTFGMKARREPRDRIKQRVEEVAKTLGLENLLDRRPEQLSGGQRQRVALGRALIREPELFLLDEPLSNLDAALRVQMRAELQQLHKRLGVTTVYVTHDQVEAMTMGDRIALLHEGRLQQVDEPEAIYARPANLFVAGFIGSPKMNLTPGRMSPSDHAVCVEALETRFVIPGPIEGAESRAERRVFVGIRPEDLRWAARGNDEPGVTMSGVVEIVEPLGAETVVTVTVAGERLLSRFPPRPGIAAGDTVELRTNPSHLHIFDSASGTRLSTEPVGEPVPTSGPTRG